jgi:drug/metabolite transporter (DMT)-like permease
MSKQLKADFALILVTVGWGASFILTKNVLVSVSTYNFLAIRFVFAFIMSSLVFYKRMIKMNKETLKLGVFIAALLFGTYAFQTMGLNYTTVSKSAFITGFSVILVPVFSAIIFRKSTEKTTIIGVVFAIIGLALLTLNGDMGLNIGDFYTLICAVSYAFYIMAVGKFTSKVDSVAFAVVQLGTVAFLSLITSLVFEKPSLPNGYGVWLNILILSVVCTSGAYIVQNIAQKYTSPTHTALIFTCEPVFAAIFAYFIYGEILNLKGTTGAVLILLGMLTAEVEFKSLINVIEEKLKLKK